MDSAKIAVSKVQEKLNTIRNKGALAIFVVLTLMLIVAIITYIVWKMTRNNLKGAEILKTPFRLGQGNNKTVSSTLMPDMHIGQDWSMTFWMYLSDFKVTSQPKLLFTRFPVSAATKQDQLRTMNPIIMLDPEVNKMFICVRTNRNIQNSPNLLSHIINPPTVKDKFYLIAAIDYIPLQRWVHVAIMTENNLLSVFVDGSMYTVHSLNDMAEKTEMGGLLKPPLFAPCNGDFKIGNYDNTLTQDATGFLSNAQFFNYAISAAQVEGLYNMGPDTGFSVLRTMGVPEYGVRSPIYRVDDEQ